MNWLIQQRTIAMNVNNASYLAKLGYDIYLTVTFYDISLSLELLNSHMYTHYCNTLLLLHCWVT